MESVNNETLVKMKPSLVERYPGPALTEGYTCVTTLTTAGLAWAAAWTMAESSVMVTPGRRFTDCGLVGDCSWSTPRVTPPDTSAVSTMRATTTRNGLQRRAAGAGRASSPAAASDGRTSPGAWIWGCTLRV